MDIEKDSEANVNSYSLNFLNADGKKLFCKYWASNIKPKAIVFIIHGYGEHCATYDTFAKKLSSHALFVFSHDHVGHGQSEGKKAYIKKFGDYVRDMFQHLNIVRTIHPRLPIFLCGNSMGGTLAIMAALKAPGAFAGIVFISPALSLNTEIFTPFRRVVVRIVRKIYPGCPMGLISEDVVCSTEEGRRIIRDDPLRWHGSTKACVCGAFLDALEEIEPKLASLDLPFLIHHGEEDKLCDLEGAMNMYHAAKSEDKQFIAYKNAYHDLLLENNETVQQVTNNTIEWIMIRVKEQKT